MVKDIYSGSVGSYPANLTAVGSTLYFTASDDTNGTELWKSDGTEAGTVMIKDINGGSEGSYPEFLTVVGDTLYYKAYTETLGYELWESDGTEAGTVVVKDIQNGSDSSSPEYLTAVGNTLYFRASDGTNGIELWRLLVDSSPPVIFNIVPIIGSTITNTTPTVTFDTDEAATCRLSFIDESYDDMSSDVICSGGGTTGHFCTTPDLGSNGNKAIYLACVDDTNNKDTAESNTHLTYTLSITIPTTTPLPTNTPTPTFYITPTPTATPTPQTPSIISISDIGILKVLPSITTYYFTSSNNLTIRGATSPLATVILTIRSNPLTCHTIADANGNYSCTFNQTIPNGTHTLYADAFFPGNTSASANPLTLSIQVFLAQTGQPAVLLLLPGILTILGTIFKKRLNH